MNEIISFHTGSLTIKDQQFDLEIDFHQVRMDEVLRFFLFQGVQELCSTDLFVLRNEEQGFEIHFLKAKELV